MRIVAALSALALMSLPALAAPLPVPTGPVVLTVTGAITETNKDGAAVFDMAMLDALAQRETTTKTPWYDGAVTFKGPLGSALLEAVGAGGSVAHVLAINDYATDIPLSDFADWPVILATRQDGKPMSVREKGPIFVIYPFDTDPALYNETYFGRSAWQVVSIDIR